jgi:transcriptional regulator with XRE-family HTH domain
LGVWKVLKKQFLTKETDGMAKNRTGRLIDDPRIGRFKDRLKEAMGDRSVRGFSSKIRASEGALRSYLRGDTYPDLPDLLELADLLGCAPAWLLTGEGPKDPLAAIQVPELGEATVADREDAMARLKATEAAYRKALDSMEWKPGILAGEAIRTAMYAHGLTLEGAVFILDMLRRQEELDAK